MGGHCLPVDPFYLVLEGARVRAADRVRRARGRGQPADALLLRREDRARAERPLEGRPRLADRDPRRLLQAGRGRPARVARAQDHAACSTSAAPSSSTTTTTCPSCPTSACPVRAARSGARRRRLRGDRDRPPGPRRRGGGRAARRSWSTSAASRAASRRRTWCACEQRAPVRVGVVGLGYWGPNLARNFDRLPGAELRWICDGSAEALEPRRRRASPRRARPTTSTSCWPTRSSTPWWSPRRCPTHAELAERVLAAGKHCFVEKPLAQSRRPRPSAWSRRREDAGRVLMVGHLLEYHPGLEKLGELAAAGELGDIHYIYGNRLNLGKLRAEENALWSLGAHDVSVVLRLAGEEPYECSAVGESYMRAGRRGRGVLLPALPVGPGRAPAPLVARPAQGAPLHGGRLEARWRRSTTWSSSASSRSTTRASTRTSPPTASTSRAPGDVWSPRISNEEPLRIECRHFVERVRDGERAALGRRERAARGARARGAAALARREPACSGRLTARPGLLLGEGVELPPTVEIGGNVVIHAGTRDRRRGADPGRRGDRQAARARGRARPRDRDAPPPAEIGDGRHGLRRRGRGRGRADRRGRGRRRPGARARAGGGGRGLGGRARLRGGQRRDDRRAGADPDRLLHHRLLDDRGRRVRGARASRSPTTTRWAATAPTTSCAAPRCGGPAGSAAGRCSRPAWRSARRRSWPPAPWWCSDVPARAVVMGVPAREVREVPDEDLLERLR